MNHKNFDELISNLAIRQDTYIYGPTGTGKSRAISDAAKQLGLPFFKKLVGSQMTESSLLGYMDGHGKYVEGITHKPFTEGGVFLMDELDNGNPNTNLVLNGLCDGELAFPCGMRYRHKDFVVVGTANTTGHGATLEYCGRNRIDAALTNRLVFVSWPLDEELELAIALEELKRFPNGELKNKTVEVLLKDIKKLRQAVKELKVPNVIISPRTTLQAVRKLAVGRSELEILQRVLLKGVDVELSKKILVQAQSIELLTNYLDENKQWLKDILTETQKKSILLDQDLKANPI